MGNTTENLDRTRAVEIASRIGVRLSAQRVELYEFDDSSHAELVARWVPGPVSIIEATTPVPLTWFPWSLGNIRPEEYLFVRNAGALPLSAGDPRTISDLAMASVVHIPVMAISSLPIGSVCAYWSEEQSSWDCDARRAVCDWALDALSACR